MVDKPPRPALLQMLQRIEVPPLESQPLIGDEIDVSPVRMQRNGVGAEITFRCPVDKTLDAASGVVLCMLLRTLVSGRPNEDGLNDAVATIVRCLHPEHFKSA